MYVEVLKTYPEKLALKLFNRIQNATEGLKSYFFNTLINWQRSFNSSSTNKAAKSIKNGNDINPKGDSDTKGILTRVLNCRGGRNIVNYYEKHNELDQCVRNELKRLIVRYVYDHKLPHGPTNIIDYVEQIVGTFPSESQVRI